MAKKKYWSTEVILQSLLPFDISLPKVNIFADVPSDKAHWTRVYQLESSKLCVARVRQKKHLSKELQLTIEAKNKLSDAEINKIISKINHELGLQEKMQVLNELRRKDILIDIAVKTNPGFRLFANSNALETAILTILSKNTSFLNFNEIVRRFILKYGTQIPWDKKLYAFPTVETLSKLTVDDWKELKIGNKARFLGNYSEAEYESFEIYANYPIYERGLEELQKLKGIGAYTSRILMVYHARRYQKAFQDAYVKEVLQHKYNIPNWSTLNEFDYWIENRWPKDPALVLHTLLVDYFPAYLRDQND